MTEISCRPLKLWSVWRPTDSARGTISDEKAPSGPVRGWRQRLIAALQMVIHLWGNGVYRPWYQEPGERLEFQIFCKETSGQSGYLRA